MSVVHSQKGCPGILNSCLLWTCEGTISGVKLVIYPLMLLTSDDLLEGPEAVGPLRKWRIWQNVGMLERVQ